MPPTSNLPSPINETEQRQVLKQKPLLYITKYSKDAIELIVTIYIVLKTTPAFIVSQQLHNHST